MSERICPHGEYSVVTCGVCSPKHTPTPWELTEDNIVVAGKGKSFVEVISDEWHGSMVAGNRKDLEFIVRAVNSHYDLIRVAKEQHSYVVSDYETSNNRHIPAKCKICKLIVKAEGV